MKKLLVSILLATMVMSFTACGGKKAENAGSDAAGNVQTEADGGDEMKDASDGTITKETLLSHEEAPAEDFVCFPCEDGGVEIDQYTGEDEIIVIPETIDGEPVVGITKGTFWNNSTVKAVKLPDSLLNLGERAFAGSSIEILICGSGLETIETSAFSQCKSLRLLELNDGVKNIKERAFVGCSSLESVYIPDSIETIEILAFETLNEKFLIMGKSGSVAETYAQEADIKFEAQ